MQGTALLAQNPQQGFPPPTGPVEMLSPPPTDSKNPPSNNNDSGIFSSTTNTTIQDTHSDCSTPPNCTTPPNNHSTPSTPPLPPGSPNSSDDRKYFCPICETLLTSQHKFTLHIRLHNNETDHQQEKQQQIAGGGYICRICSKVLSSSSSLDRHVLVHSGERPFHCKYCGDTFTTNGNMHRHMRTHNNTECNSTSSTESSSDDGGNSSTKIIRNKRTEIELNNNNKNKRIICNIDSESSRKKVRLDSTDSVTVYKCPICERTDFNSKTVLETHLQDNHPDFPSFPTTCNICNMTFNNNKLLNIHKTSVHFPSTNKQPVVGFKDLTFVDFSSEKFPLIAQRECEINLHKAGVTGMKFQCSDCNRGFPCKNSLQIHEVGCKVRIPSVDGFNNKNLQIPDDEIKRKEFFNRLNLLDNNNTSTSSSNKLKQQLLLNSNINYNENNINLVDALLHKKNPIINNNNNSKDLADIQSILTNTTLPTTNNNNDLSAQQQLQEFQKPNNKLDDSQDESQDFFSIEFRKMKLRGEFPCRLCTAVFPNLRALKGHNRAHLNNSNSSSGGTLYECNMCPHSSGDKAALIRHMRSHNGDRPYECSLCNYAFTTKANCERHLRNRHAKSTREEVKRSIIYHPSEDPTNEELNKLVTKDDTAVTMPKKPVQQLPPLHEDKPVFTTSNKFPPLISTTPPMYPPGLQTLKPTKSFILPPHNEIPSFLTPNFTPKIQVKNFQCEPEERDQEDTDEEEDDEPLDLVLDLSKKKVPDVVEEEQPQDLTKKSSPLPITTPSIPQFAQNFLKTPPKIDPATLYATQLALYRTGFPFMNPLLFPPITPPTLPPTHNPHELKERMQRFQMCGGGMITDKTFPGNNPIFPTNINENNSPILLNNYSTPKKMPDMNIEQSPVSPSTKNDHGAVKMVIKNGILMPKQKQRRYRTERPFTCEYCAAKFTLRSNMERHIKQQHPQYWSQRQKSSISTPSSSKKTLNIPTYYDSATKEKLKFSLLSHQLTKKEEEEEDSPLVIDEIEEEHVPPPTNPVVKVEENPEDLVSVSRLLDNASQQQFQEYFKQEVVIGSEEEEEEGLVASGSTSEGTDENKSESETISSPPPPSLSPSSTTTTTNTTASSNNNKKKSAYSLAPNRVSCPYCNRKFPWTSSLRRHILTHTGQKPFKCTHCPLLFTTKSNCDRHLLRKHGNNRALTIPNNNNNNTQNNNNFLMRNVPERPFKCSSCPSSTFSTYSNLKKHISNKHYSGNNDDDNNEDDEIVKQQGYEAGSSEDEKYLQNHKITTDTSQYQQQSDLPFKCHLCELSFAERHLCLDHIKIRHSTEYDLLISKNALEPNPVPPQQQQQQHDDDYNDDDVELRGKFPDYSNRKVICAFCLRRFWSAEDLRRHMRTHTGERPFSCDICKRRFTLKHSMLRHRKKHNLNFSLDGNNISDEDGNNENEANFKNLEINHQGQKEIFSDHEEKHDKKDPKDQEDDSDGVEGVDLISNLLGLRDRTIIDKVLAASADDAAKLLGVKNGVRE